jgi:hypothetical protein
MSIQTEIRHTAIIVRAEYCRLFLFFYWKKLAVAHQSFITTGLKDFYYCGQNCNHLLPYFQYALRVVHRTAMTAASAATPSRHFIMYTIWQTHPVHRMHTNSTASVLNPIISIRER